ncbi:unnamed protein product [Nezara viridula]|uniref:Structure-specific endonuclease subunit SLX1 homolog n=1 Tax=Nezara viridula TaxID=85310 RepID=A0A9P0EH30_NEZVI|nr:unnamed protein product [Nezara viridula]
MNSALSEYTKKKNYVYLLRSHNFKFKGRIYIGFTVNPNRRLKQHNAGAAYGGANKTNQKGPWEMMLVIDGFPHEILALRFEWAWQHPYLSRKLKHLQKKKSNESHLQYHLRVLNKMLQIGPWKRLPIHVQWLNETAMTEIDQSSFLYSISYASEIPGMCSIKPTPIPEKSPLPINSSLCFSCDQFICSPRNVICPMFLCNKNYHVECLAKHFLVNESEVIPLKGHCPSCKTDLLWCDVIAANDFTL